MSNSFPVTYLGTIVGHIHFTKEGLYWNYTGRLTMKKDGIYRVYGNGPNGPVNLGVCRPDHGLWYICGKVSGSSIDLENIKFIVNTTGKTERFIPLKEDIPFDSLEELDACRFAFQEDSPGIIVHAES